MTVTMMPLGSSMDSGRSQKAKSKGKEIAEGSDHQNRAYKRGDNWRFNETTNLITAIHQLQDKRNHKGFSFTSAENHEIYNNFMQLVPDSQRGKDKVINRIKVVLKMFRICEELSKRSGGGWDDVTHRPIAPSEEEYEQMILAKGDSAKFLLKGNFPWFRRMENMVDGQSARGEMAKSNPVQSQPIHVLLDSHINIHGSEQGSSDEPVDESGAAADCEETSHPPRRRSRTPSTDRVPRSEGGAFTISGSSASKRKSSSDEPNVRGNSYREKMRKKQAEGKQWNDAGFQIAYQMGRETDVIVASSDEKQACVEKLRELDFDEDEHEYCLNLLESGLKRKWFLLMDRETILKIIRKKLRQERQQSIPRPNAYAFSGSYEGFSSPNPAANTNSSHFFRPPHPAGNNFFFQPSDPSRDGSFM